MATSYKTDRYNLPQFPGDAILLVPGTTDLTVSLVAVDGVSVLVSVAGDVVCTPLSGGPDITLLSVPAYTVIPFRVRAVKAGTTATCI